MRLIRVTFSPKNTRFRLIPKKIGIGMNCRYYYYTYSFFCCRWHFKEKKPKSFYEN